jgi:hypothetical protein
LLLLSLMMICGCLPINHTLLLDLVSSCLTYNLLFRWRSRKFGFLGYELNLGEIKLHQISVPPLHYNQQHQQGLIIIDLHYNLQVR